MIQQKIIIDVKEEFIKIKKNIGDFLQEENDLQTQKDYLRNYIPSEIVFVSEILLDTVLNYLMKAAINDLKNVDVELQNDFFDQDYKAKIRNWVKLKDKKLQLDPHQIVFSSDPRWKLGLINSSTSFILGTTATFLLFDSKKVDYSIISGLFTVIASSYVFKKSFERAEPKARSIIKSDVEDFINNAEQQVIDWLKNVVNVFDEEFNNFCNSRSVNINGQIK